jgi:hypothetical protein
MANAVEALHDKDLAVWGLHDVCPGGWYPQLRGDPKAEGLVLHGGRKGGRSRLEDVGRGSTSNGEGPLAARELGEEELLLDAGEGDPYLSVYAERSGAQLAEALVDLFLGQWGRRKGRRRWLFALGKEDESAGAVAAELAKESEGVVDADVEVVSDHGASWAFGEKTVEKGDGPPAAEGFREKRKGDGEQRDVENGVLEDLFGVGKAKVVAGLPESGDTLPVHPDVKLFADGH